MFHTAIMAFIANSYVLFTVFDNPYIAMSFGLIWGLLILNLDRFIVTTIKKRECFKDEFIQAIPRILLAFILAIETSPIIAKLLSPKGEFDFNEVDAEMGIKNLSALKRYQSELQKKTVAKMNDMVYVDIKED